MIDCSNLPRVYVLGASLTIQFGPFLEAELAGKMHYDRKRDSSHERAEDDLDIPRGANAGDSSMVRKYLEYRRDHDPIPADILLLSCGLHDIKTDPVTGAKQVPVNLYEPNLRASIAAARAMNLRVFWLRVTPVVDEIHNARSRSFRRFADDVVVYNEIADRVMTQLGVDIIDLYSLCKAQVPHALVDHIHYNEEARREQARFIAGKLLGRTPT